MCQREFVAHCIICLCESGDNMALWSEGKVDQSDSEGESEGERMNDEEKEEDENEQNEDASTGWAEAMAKILGKKTTSGILEKNKELEKIKAAERQEQLERKKQVSSVIQAQDDVHHSAPLSRSSLTEHSFHICLLLSTWNDNVWLIITSYNKYASLFSCIN